jgi:hypothetical protein
MSGTTGLADRFLHYYNTLDFATRQPNGAGLETIRAPIRDDMDGFRAYAAAQRALALWPFPSRGCVRRLGGDNWPRPEKVAIVRRGVPRLAGVVRSLGLKPATGCPSTPAAAWLKQRASAAR